MKLSIDKNKFINHYVNHAAIFAACFGFGNYIRIGFIICKNSNNLWYELQLFYWRIFITFSQKTT